MIKSNHTISDPIKQKQQIALLKELHRPLEGFEAYYCKSFPNFYRFYLLLEHWGHLKFKGLPLDPVGSDKLFKHHIARLQDIYVNRKFVVPKPPHIQSLSPVTHLYGPRG